MYAKFYHLDPFANYDIISGETGLWVARGIQGGYAMTRDDWDEGDEAWPQGTTEFDINPCVEVAS